MKKNQQKVKRKIILVHANEHSILRYNLIQKLKELLVSSLLCYVSQPLILYFHLNSGFNITPVAPAPCML